MVVFTVLLAFVATLALAHYLSWPIAWLRVLDHPNDRSLHHQTIPRTGGLAILGGGSASSLLNGLLSPAAHTDLVALLPGLVPLVAISFIDDCHGISVRWRLPVHLWAAVSLLLAGFAPDSLDLPGFTLPLPAWAAIPLTPYAPT